jgi:cation diffusion facilitator CzcD-associated flavoprotein CzcO
MNQARVTPTNTYSGRSGLALAARLKALNVKVLIVDKLPQIGSSWRRRYKVSLCRPLLFPMLNSLKDHKVTHASVYRSLPISGFSKRLSRVLDPK